MIEIYPEMHHIFRLDEVAQHLPKTIMSEECETDLARHKK